MAKYYVTAPMVIARRKDPTTPEGPLRYAYRHAVLEDLDEDDAKRLVEEGFLSKSEPEPLTLAEEALAAATVPGVREPGPATGDDLTPAPAAAKRTSGKG